jgi:indolepyruvate ferredoxin oxidoreductase alpha subunit
VLVVDASAGLAASATRDGFKRLGTDLVAPSLMWSEATSALHELLWRGQIECEDATATFGRLERAPVKRRNPAAMRRTAWQIAQELGWAKTYDAEYLALARLLDTRVVTLDARLARGAKRLGLVIGVHELGG